MPKLTLVRFDTRQTTGKRIHEEDLLGEDEDDTRTDCNQSEEKNFRPYVVDDRCIKLLPRPPPTKKGIWGNHFRALWVWRLEVERGGLRSYSSGNGLDKWRMGTKPVVQNRCERKRNRST